MAGLVVLLLITLGLGHWLLLPLLAGGTWLLNLTALPLLFLALAAWLLAGRPAAQD